MKNKYVAMCATLFVLSMEILAEEQKSLPIQYNNRISIVPTHPCYERIKPNALYVGIEGYVLDFVHPKKVHCFLDAEFRMGYNFLFSGKEHLTPFLGIGYFEEFNVCHWEIENIRGIIYGTMGVLYEHEFNRTFSLGLNSKLILGGSVFNELEHKGSFVVGVDTAIPLTFRMGKKKNWDFRLEPFNLYLHQSKCDQVLYGLRSTVGYSF